MRKFTSKIYKIIKFIARLKVSFEIKQNILRSLFNLPKYFSTRRSWLRKGGKIDKEFLMLHDFYSESGLCSGDYFHQDLLVANFIYKKNPIRHIDVGSRIDGFVSHVASFRKIVVLDIRPLSIKSHENISFMQADIISKKNLPKTDSLSCLHAIEHFGLGRYGDKVNIDGHLIALKNLISMVEKGGTFYLSCPLSNKNQVHFNSQRVFHPGFIPNLKIVKENLKIIRFDYINEEGDLLSERQYSDFFNNNYGCGIYTFKKI